MIGRYRVPDRLTRWRGAYDQSPGNDRPRPAGGGSAGLCPAARAPSPERRWIETRWSLDGILDDEALATEELSAYRPAGRQSIFDLTNIGLRRDPEAVRRISEATGVHVVMGCGWYRQPFHPAEELIDRTSTQALADRLLEEINNGLDGTTVRQGIIGEISSNKGASRRKRSASFAPLDARRSGRAWRSPPTRWPVRSVSSTCASCSRRASIQPASPSDIRTATSTSSTTRRSCARARYVQFDNIGYTLPVVASARSSAHRRDRGAASARLGASAAAQPGRVPPLAPQGVRGQRLRLSDPRLSTEVARSRRSKDDADPA